MVINRENYLHIHHFMVGNLIGTRLPELEMIYSFFPKKFDYFIEPFVFSFVVTLNFDTKAKIIVNDLNPNIINIAKALKEDPVRVYENAQNVLRIQNLHKEMRELEPKTPLEYIMKNIYLKVTSYASYYGGGWDIKYGGFSYGINTYMNNSAGLNLDTMKKISNKLQNVEFYMLDYKIFLDKILSEINGDILLFLDPPYPDHKSKKPQFDMNSFNDYINEITSENKNIKILFPHENTSEIRKFYHNKGFKLHSYNSNEEVLISN